MHFGRHATGPAAEAPRPGPFAALVHRDFRLFIAGQGLSLVGTWLQSTALAWLVYRLTHSTVLMGTVSFCSQFPMLPLGPLGGVVADRYSRRRVILVMQMLMLCQAATLAWWTWTGAISTGRIVGLALALGMLSAFEIPARQSFYIHLVGKEHLANALAINAMTFNLARVAGPSIGGLLLDRFGEAVCFTLNAVSYLAVIASFLAIRSAEPRKPPEGSPLEHLKDGLRYVRGHAGLRALLTLSLASNFASAPLTLLAPVFADRIFGMGPRGYGWLQATYALGAVLGTWMLARHGRTQGLVQIVAASSLATGVAHLAYAASPGYTFLLMAAFAAGFSFLRQLPGTNTLVQSLIDERYRGRVMALYSMTVMGMLPLGNLSAGTAAGLIGPRATVVCGGLLLLASGWRFRGRKAAVEEALEGKPVG